MYLVILSIIPDKEPERNNPNKGTDNETFT